MQLTLCRLDLPQAAFESEDREEIAESLCTDETAVLETPGKNGQNTLYTPGSHKSRKNFGKPVSSFSDLTCKDTIASGSVDYQLKMLNFELYIYIKASIVQNLTNLQYFIITIIGIDYC